MAGSNAHGDPTVTISTTHAGISVNSSANSVALAANTQRRWALFVNHGSTPVFLAIATSTGTAVADKGIRLAATGGTFEMSPTHGNLDTRTVHAVTKTATGQILVVAEAS